MKILSWNVNGIRAVYKKNFLDWLIKTNADIVCLQEIKASANKIPKGLTNLKKYYSYFNPAQKDGYSGVAVFSKEKPLKIENKIGINQFNREGRVLKLKYPDFTLICLYFPHGGRGKEKLKYKLRVYNQFIKYLSGLKNKNIILAGDFNIAHQEIDLARPKQNKNNIMFTSDERKQIDKIVKLGFIDTFRKFDQKGNNYTWWPYFANARQRNLGWRIDYVFASKRLTPKLKDAFILKNVKGSDHCPVGIKI